MTVIRMSVASVTASLAAKKITALLLGGSVKLVCTSEYPL